MKDLAAKTQRLKFERRLRRVVEQDVNAVPIMPCDCKAWLKKQVASKVKKPRAMLNRPALVLVAPAAPKNLRNSEYNRHFEQGTAPWYHIPVASLQDYRDEQIAAIRYCALGTTTAGMGERSARYLWSVVSINLMPRHMLTVEQAGSLKASDEPYWLFELGEAVALEKVVTHFPQHFAAKLTLKSEVLAQQDFNRLLVVNI